MFAIAALLLAACGSSDKTAHAAPAQAAADEPRLTRQMVMTGLQNPWDLAFLPDGTMFITEKCRGLSVRLPDGTVNRLFGTAGSAMAANDFFCVGQSGMHGVAVDPQFAANRFVYVFMPSSLRSSPRTNRVVRLVVNDSFTSVGSRTDIVTDIALKDRANAIGGAGAHSGGRIRFGPDGYLYVTTGDNHDATLPQDLKRLGGKVLRIDRDGKAAPGNNVPAGFDPRIFTYGHRNPQGLAFHPKTGQAFVAEHGPNHSDEVTALVAGGNAGWDPKDRPGLTCPDDYCGYAGTASTMPMTDIKRFPDAMRPVWNNDGRSQGMGPAVFLEGKQWTGWVGGLLVGVMGGQRVDLLSINTIGPTATRSTVSIEQVPAARYRAAVLSPDGHLWITTDGGEVWRFESR
jgi:glucose/arabinose dehydrogenase